MRNADRPASSGLFCIRESHSRKFGASDRGKMFKEELAFSFQAAPDPYLEFHVASLGCARLWQGVSTGHTIRLREPGMTTVLFPRRGAIEVEAAGRRHKGGAGDVLVFTPNERATAVMPDQGGVYSCDVVMIPTASSRELGAPREGILSTRRLEGVFSEGVTGKVAQALQSYCHFVFSEARREESAFRRARARKAAAALLVDMVTDLIDAQGEPDDARGRSVPVGDRRLVQRAEALMHERFEEPLSIGGIASSLCVTPRRLQYAFQNVREEAPRTVLLNIRLDAARQRFFEGHPDATVTGVAHDCGLTHVGRFAVAYANRFGELPSETRRKRQIG